jgi:hypothetical protein
MSKRDTSGTDEVGILSEAFLREGSLVSGWSLFEDQRTPAELADFFAEAEAEAAHDEGERSRILRAMLDLVLEGWEAHLSSETVGHRAQALAASLAHRAAPGPLRPLMVPTRAKLVAQGSLETARRILDFWFFETLAGRALSPTNLGKKLLAIAKFLSHPALDDFSLTTLARACGEPPATMMERVRRFCNRPIEAAGGLGKAVWQQGPTQRAGSSQAQKSYNQQKKSR